MGRPQGSKNKPKNNSVSETKPVAPVKPKPTTPVAVVVGVGSTPNAPTKHKGRPQGSKNKSKVLTAVDVTPEIIDTPVIIDGDDPKFLEPQLSSDDDVIDDMSMYSEDIEDKTNKTPIRTMKEYQERVATMTDEEKAVSLPPQTNEKKTKEQREIESKLTQDSHACLLKCIQEPAMEKFVDLVECVTENMGMDKRERLKNSTEFEKPKYKTMYHKSCSILAVYFGLDFNNMRTWLDKRYPASVKV